MRSFPPGGASHTLEHDDHRALERVDQSSQPKPRIERAAEPQVRVVAFDLLLEALDGNWRALRSRVGRGRPREHEFEVSRGRCGALAADEDEVHARELIEFALAAAVGARRRVALQRRDPGEVGAEVEQLFKRFLAGVAQERHEHRDDLAIA